jgi:P27 family predicted phage terminase small subunit
MRGRKPIPTTLKLIRGNPGHRPPPAGEPKPMATIPKCPRHLNKEARAEWRRMAKVLDELGILTIIDKAVFVSYCQAWATLKQAREIADNMEIMIPSKEMVIEKPDGTKIIKKGGLVNNPIYKLIDMQNTAMMKALVEMGMSPSSRSRVKVAEKPKDEGLKGRFFEAKK